MVLLLDGLGQMKDFYTINPKRAEDIVKRTHIKMQALSADCGYSSSWLNHAIKNGRMSRQAFDTLKSKGVDLEPAVIGRPETVLVQTDIGRILRIVNMSYHYPVWVIAEEEKLSKTKVIAHIQTWEQTRFGLTKKDLEEALRNWEEK